MGRIKGIIMRYRDATGAKHSEVPKLEDMPSWVLAPPTDEQIQQEADDAPAK